MSLLIGGIALDAPLCLAPMAGVTSMPVRELFARLGAALVHTEMVSCAGLVRDNGKTSSMLRLSPSEGPVVLQLFAPDASTLLAGAERALDIVRREGWPSFAALGINMACPMPKVTKRGAGSALLRAPGEARSMVHALKGLGLPVWAKIRRTEDAEATLRFIEGLAEAGADSVCLHGRTPAQRYEGRADRQIVAAAAARFPGLIAASGDVRAASDVTELLDMGCALVMLARGAMADPWLFPRALHELGRDVPREMLAPSPGDRARALRELGERAREVLGERQGVVLTKRIMGGLLKGMAGAAELRCRAGSARELDELMGILDEMTHA